MAIDNVKNVKSNIRYGPNKISENSSNGFIKLHLACFFGRVKVVRLLKELRADVNRESRTPLIVTPLHSTMGGLTSEIFVIAKQLLEARANAKQSGGWTALHSGTTHKDVIVIKLLLSFGTNFQIFNDDKSSAYILDYTILISKGFEILMLI